MAQKFMFMRDFFYRGLRKIRFLYGFVKSLVFGYLNRKKYHSVKSFVLFIGYPRSGHSLIAALLDAHPNIVMGMEWAVLPHLTLGYNKLQVFYSLVHNAKRFSIRLQNIWSGYSYKVNNWQGRFDKLEVIGDKFGGRTSIMLLDNPELLQLIDSKIKFPLKMIHVIRNPFDTITTMTNRYFENAKKSIPPGPADLLPFIKTYFDRVVAVSTLKRENKYQIYDLYHEEFIAMPEKGLKELLEFLDIHYDLNYIRECVNIVYKEPHKSRYEIDWDKNLILFVENKISEFDFLSRYNFQN